MRSKTLLIVPLLVAAAAAPIAATSFANAIGPSIMASMGQPPTDASGTQSRADPQAPDPQTANSPTAPAMPADPSYHGQPYVGALTPPPSEAMNKSYPVCSAQMQDNCRNRDGQ